MGKPCGKLRDDGAPCTLDPLHQGRCSYAGSEFGPEPAFVTKVDFRAKQKDLGEAIKLTNDATAVGRILGGIASVGAWWPSGAPWWAIPVFALVIGWVGGQIYGKFVAKTLERELKAKYPELRL